MKELTFQTRIVDSVKAQGGYARKLAHRFAIGVPDLIIHLPNYAPFLMECKWISDPIEDMNRAIALTEKQKLELIRINAPNALMGSTVGVVVGFKLSNKFGLKAYAHTHTRFTLTGGMNDPEVFTLVGKHFDMPRIADKLNILKIVENTAWTHR